MERQRLRRRVKWLGTRLQRAQRREFRGCLRGDSIGQEIVASARELKREGRGGERKEGEGGRRKEGEGGGEKVDTEKEKHTTLLSIPEELFREMG